MRFRTRFHLFLMRPPRSRCFWRTDESTVGAATNYSRPLSDAPRPAPGRDKDPLGRGADIGTNYVCVVVCGLQEGASICRKSSERHNNRPCNGGTPLLDVCVCARAA